MINGDTMRAHVCLEDVAKQSKVGVLIDLSHSADILSAVLSHCPGAGGNI